MNATLSHKVIPIVLGCAALGLSQSALAQLHIVGTVPVGAPGSNGGIVIVLPTTQKADHTNYTAGGLLKFRFRAPTPASTTHVAYVMGYCVGPATNPCGLATSIVVSVAGGGAPTFALIDASAFADGNVLAAVNPTSVPIRFEIDLD